MVIWKYKGFLGYLLFNFKIYFFLEIVDVPSILHILPIAEVFVGSSIVLPCSAEGNPGVNFRWRFSNGQTIKKTTKYSVSSNGSLVILNAGIRDAMNYTCAPHSDLGDGEQRHTELVVLCKYFEFVFVLNLYFLASSLYFLKFFCLDFKLDIQ